MEFLGAVASGITLVALFKHTFDVLDLIHLYQTQDEDFNNLQLEFKLEKCRLYNWGVALKLTDAANKTPLRGWHSEMIVIECLERIIRLFNDAGKLREKYGCSEISPTELRRIEQQPMYNKTTGNIAAAFDNFKIRASRSVKQPPLPLRKTKWIIRDRKKYLILVQEIRTLIDSLEKITEELTSVVKLESMLQARVNLIPNIDTLLMIANVWKESHPRVSSAASTQAEGLSMSSGKVQDISDWQTLVGSEDAADISTANLEEMTITELKHLVLRSNQELDQLRNSLSGDIQRLADRSRTESNGLKVITAFTLIFLPVTFIAT
ncbi:prion-inhibition and propagation-domain-containing protein [Xylariaceae sp. FL1272]|nr:prion-inhibition and propagation-domain-containing protein [Xylariaceae sp. FL1272]